MTVLPASLKEAIKRGAFAVLATHRVGGSIQNHLMWVDYKQLDNLLTAEMWKNLLEGEGLPAKILPEGDILDWSETSKFRLLVPKGREHVADEILRKL